MRPSSIEVNGVRYLLRTATQTPFRIVHESSIVKRRVEAGGQRGERETTREDILSWRWSDWSLGEGQKWIDTGRKNTFFKYLKSGGAVDIRTKNQVRLGLALSSDLEIATVDSGSGPHLTTAGRPVVAYSASTTATWNRRESGSWGTPAGSGNGAATRGQIEALNNKVFIPSRTDIVRVNAANAPASGTEWQTFSADGCLVADNRLYFIDRLAGENVALKVVDLQPASSAPFTPTTLATIGGWDQGEGLAAEGESIYVLLGVNNERVGIFTIQGTDTTTFKEFVRLPENFRLSSGTLRKVIALNGVVFVGGFFTDPHGNVDDPTLLWATSQGSGAFRIRERGDGERISCLYPSMDNQALMGTNEGRVYAYNMNTGGFYQFASGGTSTDDTVTSFTYDSGQFFVGTIDVGGGNGDVWATLASGAGKYPSSVKVEGSRWDFDIANEQKILLEVEVFGNFPDDTSAEFSFESDDGSEVTTDASGSTMSTSTTGTTTFTISDADTERTFGWIKPNLTLKTSDTSATPIVYSVQLKATTSSKQKFIECTVDLDLPTGHVRVPERVVTGAKAAAEFEALIENSSNRIITVKPHFEKAGPPHPRSSDSYTCLLDDSSLEWDDQGHAAGFLRMRVL